MAHKNKTNLSPYKRSSTGQSPQSGRPARHAQRHTQQQGRHRKPEVIYPIEEANDRLLDIFRNHDFEHITHQQRHQLASFYQLLMTNQKSENFTRLISFRDIAIKHFIDCLIVPQLVKIEFPLLDVGTGPGFPGIPLKILFPNEQIILAEGVQKRVEFLKAVRDSLKLEKLDIIGRNVNEEFLYPTQAVITRAVEDVGNTLNNVLNCLRTGGQVILMKGPNVDQEIAAAKAAKETSEYYELEKDITYTLPKTTHDRRLLVYRKIKSRELL